MIKCTDDCCILRNGALIIVVYGPFLLVLTYTVICKDKSDFDYKEDQHEESNVPGNFRDDVDQGRNL